MWKAQQGVGKEAATTLKEGYDSHLSSINLLQFFALIIIINNGPPKKRELVLRTDNSNTKSSECEQC